MNNRNNKGEEVMTAEQKIKAVIKAMSGLDPEDMTTQELEIRKIITGKTPTPEEKGHGRINTHLIEKGCDCSG